MHLLPEYRPAVNVIMAPKIRLTLGYTKRHHFQFLRRRRNARVETTTAAAPDQTTTITTAPSGQYCIRTNSSANCGCFNRILKLDCYNYDQSDRQRFIAYARNNYRAILRHASASQTSGDYVLFKDLLDTAMKWNLASLAYRHSLLGHYEARHDCDLVERLCNAMERDQTYVGLDSDVSCDSGLELSSSTSSSSSSTSSTPPSSS